MIIGNLGADVELKYTAGNQPVATFRLATSESWTDKEGQKQERTEWHRVVVFGRVAELCGKYLSKGRQVYVEGRLQTRQWQDKDGNTRYTTEINAKDVLFLNNGSRGDDYDNGGNRGGYGGGNQYNNNQYGNNQYDNSQYGGGNQYNNNSQYGGGSQYNNNQYNNGSQYGNSQYNNGAQYGNNGGNGAPADVAPDFSAEEEDNFPF